MTANQKQHKHTIYISPELWKRAKAKAGPQLNMSRLIRILLLAWLDGRLIEIKIGDLER